MSATNILEACILKLFFLNEGTGVVAGGQTPAVSIGDTAGLLQSSVDGNFWLGLFDGDPTDTGAGGIETAYTGYARQAVARSTGWTVSGTSPCQAINVTAVTFPVYGGGTVYDATHVGLFNALTVGQLLLVAPFTPAGAQLTIGTGVQPVLAAGTVSFTLD